MKARMKLFPLLGVLAFVAWMGMPAAPASSAATPVPDDFAASLRGGASCGNTWTSTTVQCVGTVACGTSGTTCTSTDTYLKKGDAGDQVEDKPKNYQCYACATGGYTCGSSQSLTFKSKACITSTTGVTGVPN